MKRISFLQWGCALISLLTNLDRCDCFKALLVLPLPTKSHFTTCVVLAEELARKGHEVTVASHFPKENANYRQIIIDSEPFDKFFKAFNVTERRHANLFLSAAFMWTAFRTMVETALQSEGLQSVINSTDHYDVVLGEVGFFQQIITGLGHKFKAPVIDIYPATSPMFVVSVMGNPHTFSYVPNPLLPYGDRMTFLERLHNTALSTLHIVGEYLYLLPAQDALMRKYFKYPGAEDLPPLRELLRNVSLSLVSGHFSINYPRPYAPNMVEVGGFHLKPVKKLPQDLQKFMDGAKNGVVYFSFGSVVKKGMLGEERIRSIAAALKRLQQKVIFKWDDPAPFQGVKNILVLPWAPQQEILAHPNCLLFVTHGGYSSLIEVTRAGVPVLGIPVFADQFRNIHYYESMGIGKGLDLENFSSDELYNEITNIIKTPSFRENAKEISRRTLDRPQTPLETAIFWIEYVVRHKGAHHLKPAAVHLPYYQYLLLDVLGAMFLAIFIVYKLIWKLCCSRAKSEASKIEKIKKKNN